MRISDWSSDVCSSDLLDIAILEIGDKPPSPTQPRGEFTRALQGAVGIEQDVPPIDLERGSRVLEGRFRQCVDELINRTERGPHAHQHVGEIGRASVRERVCPIVYMSVGAGSLKKKKKK